MGAGGGVAESSLLGSYTKLQIIFGSTLGLPILENFHMGLRLDSVWGDIGFRVT